MHHTFRLPLLASLLLAAAATLHAQEITWQKMNGPRGGSAQSPLVHPQTGDLYIITTLGIMRSTDRGATWSALPQGEDYAPIGTLTIGGDGTLYGTRTRQEIGRSTDNGATWSRADSGLPVAFLQRIVVDSTGDLFVGQYNGRVYRSTNRGDLWEATDTTFRLRNFGDLVVAPDNALIVARSDSGLYRSTDRGMSWNRISGGITGGINQVVMTSEMMIAAGNNRIYRSTDSGLTWTMTDTSAFPPSVAVIGVGISPATGTLLASLASGALLRSTDNGASWTDRGAALGGGYARPFAYDRFGTIIASSSSRGLYRSTDDGLTWELIDLKMTAASILELFASDDGTVVATTQTGGVHRSTDNGLNWEDAGQFPAGSEGRHIVISHTGAFLMGTQRNGIYRSTDNGSTWQAANTGLWTIFDSTINDMMVGRNGALYAATSNSLFRSEDNGDSWWRLYNGVTSLTTTAVAEMPNGYLFVGTSDKGLFRSTDGGTSFSETGLNGAQQIRQLAASPHGPLYAVTAQGIMMSLDTGITWSLIYPQANPSRLAVNATGDLFIAMGANVLRRSDGDTAWVSVHEGLPVGIGIQALAFLSDGRLLAGTTGASIWRSESSTLGVDIADIARRDRSMASSVTPNPFSSSTIIRFHQQDEGEVSLRIIDPTGRVVEVIDGGYRNRGEQEIVVRSEGYPAGICFYELYAGGSMARGMMVVVR